MKIAIVGASGFIGRELCKEINKIKTLKITAAYNKNKPNITNIKFVKLNVKKKKNYFKILRKPDLLIHLAWSGLENYNDNSHLKKILPAHKTFLKEIIKRGLKNLVVIGTCYEYGKNSKILRENMRIKPIINYAIAKNNLRIYLNKLKKKYKFNLTWLRVFYIYGYNHNRKTLTNLLIESHKNKKELIINNKIKRDFLSVKDAAKFILAVSLKKKNLGIVNICSGKSISMKELINFISKSLNIRPVVKYGNFKLNRNFEAINFYGDNYKLNKILNF